MNDKFPISNIEDLLAKLGNNCKLFAKLDLKEDYYQIRLATESRPLTTIITHMGTCMYIRLPFGIKTAPSAFQRLIERILSGIKGVLVYLDDILVTAKNKRDLFHKLNLVQQRFKTYNVLINKEKSVFKADKLQWLGYEILAQGIRPETGKVSQILELKSPRTVKEVRQILGIINYYAKFIRELADKAAPLYALLKKGSKFSWAENESKALAAIKQLISRRECLKPFDTDSKCRVVLKIDASELEMGAVLEQEDSSGIMRPVLYWLSKYRSYEQNYSTVEKETLAIICATNRLRKYLLGRKFSLYTAYRPLEMLLSQTTCKRIIARV